MTERPFAAAIAATIPPGKDSPARMEWCKDAADAIAQVCLEHSGIAEGDVSPDTVAFACHGMRAAYEHGMNYLREQAKKLI